MRVREKERERERRMREKNEERERRMRERKKRGEREMIGFHAVALFTAINHFCLCQTYVIYEKLSTKMTLVNKLNIEINRETVK
jgi:hypothetical protein